MNQMLHDLSTWLEAQKGHEVMIRKEEHSLDKNEITDIDEVKLHLDSVSVRELEEPDPDGYLERFELVLRGEGKIYSDEGEVDLPQDTFEIPLFNHIVTKQETDGYSIETDQAHYRFYTH
ncbi:hypothetical protein GN156_16170 [bacterium LRH843]|nr:hypothetical protein [bacterium LRH843]